MVITDPDDPRHHAPYDVHCEQCGALPHRWCKRPSGHSGPFVSPHAARRRLSDQLAGRAKPRFSDYFKREAERVIAGETRYREARTAVFYKGVWYGTFLRIETRVVPVDRDWSFHVSSNARLGYKRGDGRPDERIEIRIHQGEISEKASRHLEELVTTNDAHARPAKIVGVEAPPPAKVHVDPAQTSLF